MPSSDVNIMTHTITHKTTLQVFFPHWIFNLEMNSKHEFQHVKLHLLEEEAHLIKVLLTFFQRGIFINVHKANINKFTRSTKNIEGKHQDLQILLKA